MSQQLVSTESSAVTLQSLVTIFVKVNENFSEIAAALPSVSFQTINFVEGGDTLNQAFSKVNDNFAAAFLLTGGTQQVITLSGLSADTVGAALSKIDSNFTSLYTLLGLTSLTPPQPYTPRVVPPLLVVQTTYIESNVSPNISYSSGQQIIDLGDGPDTYTGDSLYVAFSKVNHNFTELYSVFDGNGITQINANVITANNIALTSNLRAGNLFAYDSIESVGTIVASGFFYPNGTPVASISSVDGNLIPTTSNLFTVGSVTNQFSQGYFSTNITLAGSNVTTVNGQLYVDGDLVSGNYSNANVIAFLPTYSGNLDSVNVLVVQSGSTVGDFAVGGNLFVGGNLTYQNVETGNLEVANSIIVTGNVSASNFIGNVIGNISGNIIAPGSSTQVLFNDNGVTNALAGFTFDKTTNLVIVTGNVTAEYFLGNGRYLSGIDATSIQNGTSNVKVYLDGNVDVNTGFYTWNFDTVGNLNLQGGGKLNTNGTFNENVDLIAGPNGWAELQSFGGNNYVWVDDYGAYIGTNWLQGPRQWTFGLDGNLYAPGNISVVSNISASSVNVANTLSAGSITVADFTVIDSTGNVVTARLEDSGVVPGTYGNASSVPVITLDSKGRVIDVSTTSVAGVSGLNYDSATGNLSVSTSAGTTYYVDLNVGTTDIPTFLGVNVTGNVTSSNVYASQRAGFTAANGAIAVYQVYNSTTNSLDTIFG